MPHYEEQMSSFLLIGIHLMQDCTAITRHGVEKNKDKKIKAYRKLV